MFFLLVGWFWFFQPLSGNFKTFEVEAVINCKNITVKRVDDCFTNFRIIFVYDWIFISNSKQLHVYYLKNNNNNNLISLVCNLFTTDNNIKKCRFKKNITKSELIYLTVKSMCLVTVNAIILFRSLNYPSDMNIPDSNTNQHHFEI